MEPPGPEEEGGGGSEARASRIHRDLCPVWRSEDDLPPVAQAFYGAAAEASATPLTTLLVATAQVERKLQLWGIERERTGRLREMGEGAATEVKNEGQTPGRFTG